MKTRITLFMALWLAVCLATNGAQAQGGWQKIYPMSSGGPHGDGIFGVRQTLDGGYVLAGIAKHNSAAHENRIVKVNDQGAVQWEQTYPLEHPSWASNVELAPGGGYYVSGRRRNPVTYLNEVYLQRLDNSGNQLWVNFYPEAGYAFKGCATADGGYMTLAYYDNNSIQDTIVLVKTASDGTTQWLRRYPNIGTGIERLPHSIIETANGDFVMEGFNGTLFPGRTFLWRLDSNGDSIWQNSYGQSANHPEYIGKVVETPGGDLVVAGNDALSFGAHDLYVFKTNASGTLLWQKYYGQQSAFGTDLDLTADGGYIVSGYSHHNTLPKVLLLKTDSDGNQQWLRVYTGNNPAESWKAYSVRQTSDGGYIVGGAKISLSYTTRNMYLIKTDDQGEIYGNTLQGYVYDDNDDDCLPGASEHRFSGWLVRAQSPEHTFWASADSAGFYSVRVDTGNYQIVLFPSGAGGSYWQPATCGADTLTATIPGPYTVFNANFPRQATMHCPLMRVELGTPFLRRCFNNTYYVHYCNDGTVPANGAYVELQLDSFLLADTASINVPWTRTGPWNYTLQLGHVGIGECGTVAIDVLVDCNAVLGQTHCSRARIFPDSACLSSPWGGAVITLEADCLGDSVVFYLHNNGADMSGTLAYTVYEDNVLVRPGLFSLDAGATLPVTIATVGGATYRIEAQQEQGFPAMLGDTLAALAVEGCGSGLNTGFVVQFANYDGSPFVDIDCRPNIGAYDPNDKSASPQGYGAEHYIYDYTALDYHIRFQNTGTDTAFNVVIRDTLSPFLDLTTLQVGASSHDFRWSVYGQDGVRAIEFVFENIMLPDSNVNEPASHGFVGFSVRQLPGNPVGTRIENQAAIYFDFNEPIFTNTTFHEIGEDFVPVQISSDRPLQPTASAPRLYPNPTAYEITVEWTETAPYNFDFVLFDALGRECLRSVECTSPWRLDCSALPAGLYYYRIECGGKMLDSGRISVRR